MKPQAIGSLFSAVLGASAQLIGLVSPTPDTHVAAGQPFTATVSIASTTSSVDVIALFFGAKNGMAQNADLGQMKLTTVIAPQFNTGPGGQMVHDAQITLPMNMINGLNQTYNLTVGEFYTLGAENTPQTYTVQVPVFVASP